MGNSPRRVYIYPRLDQNEDGDASPYLPPGVFGVPQASSIQTQSVSSDYPDGYLADGGGLFGMLLRRMQQSGDRPDVDSGSAPNGMPDADNDGYPQGGLPDRLTAPQNSYQSFAGNTQPSLQLRDPNFRQVSRAPIAIRTQSTIAHSGRSVDQVPQSDLATQPGRSLSDRMQAYWDHPNPHGVVSALKDGLAGIAQAVQGSIDATSAPSTEEEAFRQNLGREQGPIGAWQAISLLNPRVPRGTGGIFARPLVDVVANRGLPLRAGEQIARQRINGVPTSTGTSAVSVVPGNAYLPTEFQNPSAVGSRLFPPRGVIPPQPAPPWVSDAPAMAPDVDRGGTRVPSIGPVPPTSVSTFPEWLARKTLSEYSGNVGGDDEVLRQNQKRQATGGVLGSDGDKPTLPWLSDSPGIEAGIGEIEAARKKGYRGPLPKGVNLLGWKPPLKKPYGSYGGLGRGGPPRKGVEGDPDDLCNDMHIKEQNKCFERYDNEEYADVRHFNGCLRRSAERWDLCNKTGYPPIEPKEWGPDDEEIFNRDYRLR